MPPRAPEQTVYSYYMPEVRDVVRDVLVHDADRLNDTLTQNYMPGLDTWHNPVMDRFEEHLIEHDVEVRNRQFPNRYPVNGSSEALFHLIAQYVTASEGYGRLLTLEGEYQGFQAYTYALNSNIGTLTEEQVLSGAYPGGLFLVSNPSSRDGNYLPHELQRAILDKPDNQVILDLAYVGMADPQIIYSEHPNVIAVVASMSKPWGLYYFRAGFCWTREPVPSLYANKWFKNIPSLTVAEAVLEHVPATYLRHKYQRLQADAIAELQQEFPDLDIKASDAWLLAYADNGPEKYVRSNGRARFCLTPYYMAMENTL